MSVLYMTTGELHRVIYTEDPQHTLNMDCLNVIVIVYLSTLPGFIARVLQDDFDDVDAISLAGHVS